MACPVLTQQSSSWPIRSHTLRLVRHTVTNTAYLNGAGIDEPLRMDDGSDVSDYLADILGSVTHLTDNTGASIGAYYYDPYGAQLPDSSPVTGNPFTYTAREDDGTGLYFYRNRFYDPVQEVFISQDPLGDAQRYVEGNPIGNSDPLGLELFRYGTDGTPIPPYDLSAEEEKCYFDCLLETSGLSILGAGGIIAGQPTVEKPRKGVGGPNVTPKTSPASKAFRGAFPGKIPGKAGGLAKQVVGTNKVGGVLGRATPYAGGVVLTGNILYCGWKCKTQNDCPK